MNKLNEWSENIRNYKYNKSYEKTNQDHIIKTQNVDHRMQDGGEILPPIQPPTFSHTEVAGPSLPRCTMLMLKSWTFLQGTFLLHCNFTASLAVDVPQMFWNFTSLIWIFEKDYNKKKKIKLGHVKKTKTLFLVKEVTWKLHGGFGQYRWSMLIGLWTSIIWRFLKRKFETKFGSPGEGHVLIRTPLLVPLKIEFLTINPWTLFSPLNFPRLPTLIPWPGPQLTLLISKLKVPDKIAMQSSPVAMSTWWIFMWFDEPILIPSVLGLSPGALMLTRVISKCWTEKKLRWPILLLIDLMRVSLENLTNWNPMFIGRARQLWVWRQLLTGQE